MSQKGSTKGGGNISGNTVQFESISTGAFITCNVQTPFDNTIPQQTEGCELLTLPITPTKATNLLEIEFFSMGGENSNGLFTLALFQDATASSIAANFNLGVSGQRGFSSITLKHVMTAGTTSLTTFKIRGGLDQVGSVDINGSSAAKYGGVAATVLTIREIEI